VKEGEKVVAGEALFTLRDPFLRAERDIARARLAEVQAYYNAALVEDRVQALQIKEDVNSARAELEKVETRFNQLTVYSKTTGNFYLPPESQIMLNRFVSQGELLAYVIDRQESLIRAIVNQNDIGMVLSNDFLAAQVELRVASWPGEVFTGFVVRAVPTASRMLPSAVLGTAYGGSVVVDPTDDSGMKALEEWFQIDIKLEDSPNQSWLGTRAWVRLELGSEPLALQLYRTLRQLFMKTLSI
jgi:putative peptide zinc metalloprotease protein